MNQTLLGRQTDASNSGLIYLGFISITKKLQMLSFCMLEPVPPELRPIIYDIEKFGCFAARSYQAAMKQCRVSLVIDDHENP
jgi:hypothetical protein